MDLAAVLAHIERNLAGDLSLRTLARRSGVSPHHFHRLFHAAVGEPPLRYVRRLRLERAAARLKLSPARVTDVALDAGYAAHEAFTRAFSGRFGVPPRRFRAARPPADPPRGFSPRIAVLPARRIACLRWVGPYDRAAAAFRRLASWAAERRVLGATMLGFYLDDQEITAATQTRCDVALVVPASVDGHGAIRVRDQPAQQCAVFEHTGGVAERRRLHEVAFRHWLPRSGHRPAGVPFEEYAVVGRGVDQRSTRIHIPLAPR